MDIQQKVYSIAKKTSMQITKKRALKIVKILARYYGFSFRQFSGELDGRIGYYDRFKKRIAIHKDCKGKETLKVFFHELGHGHCQRNGIWKTYHTGPYKNKKGEYIFSKKVARGTILTGFKAECWVDRWAEKEMHKWFPNLDYESAYGSEESRLWLNENHLSYYRQYL